MAAGQRFTVLNLAAGGIVVNVLAGSMFEFVAERPRAIRLWGVQDTVANANIVINVTYGTVTAIEDPYPLPTVPAATPGDGPNRNDHELVGFMARPGSRIKLGARNAGTAAHGAGLGARFLLEHQDF
jgi:hypothetical protein